MWPPLGMHEFSIGSQVPKCSSVCVSSAVLMWDTASLLLLQCGWRRGSLSYHAFLAGYSCARRFTFRFTEREHNLLTRIEATHGSTCTNATIANQIIVRNCPTPQSRQHLLWYWLAQLLCPAMTDWAALLREPVAQRSRLCSPATVWKWCRCSRQTTNSSA